MKCLFYDFKNDHYIKNGYWDNYLHAKEVNDLNIEIPYKFPLKDVDYGFFTKC